MKKNIFIILTGSFLLIILNASIVKADETGDNLTDIKKELSEKEKDLNDLKRNIKILKQEKDALEEGVVGIAPGIMYLSCWKFGGDDYITSAYADTNGIHIRKDLNNVTRIFPSFTLFFKPFYDSDSMIWPNTFVGCSLGVNEGVNNEGTGFALALGLSSGIVLKNRAHFGIFIGSVLDPSVKVLDDTRTSTTSGEQELVTKEIMGKYIGVGVMLSIAL